jgi:nitroreductase
VVDRALSLADLRECVGDAVTAPSIHNSQPWRFSIEPSVVDVFTDESRWLRAIDSTKRELYLSVGAAVFNVRLAFIVRGRHPDRVLLPDDERPEWVAHITDGGPRRPDPAAKWLHSVLRKRRTNRTPYSPVAPSSGELELLVEAARSEGTDLLIVTSGDERAAIIDAIRCADAAQGDDPAYRAELLHWTTADPGRTDGVPVAAIGPWNVHQFIPLRDFAIDRPVVGRGVGRYETEPPLALLTTMGDTLDDWLSAGQALQRVLLTATAQGLACSFMTQPLEVAPVRARLGSRSPSRATQMVMRFGYAAPTSGVPRRPVEDVLI